MDIQRRDHKAPALRNTVETVRIYSTDQESIFQVAKLG